MQRQLLSQMFITAALLTFSTSLRAEVLYSENFAGTTVDTSKWTLGSDGVSQNNGLIVSGPGWDNARASTVSSWARSNGSVGLRVSWDETAAATLAGAVGRFYTPPLDTGYQFPLSRLLQYYFYESSGTLYILELAKTGNYIYGATGY